jgi:hypothetical protein
VDGGKETSLENKQTTAAKSAATRMAEPATKTMKKIIKVSKLLLIDKTHLNEVAVQLVLGFIRESLDLAP